MSLCFASWFSCFRISSSCRRSMIWPTDDWEHSRQKNFAPNFLPTQYRHSCLPHHWHVPSSSFWCFSHFIYPSPNGYRYTICYIKLLFVMRRPGALTPHFQDSSCKGKLGNTAIVDKKLQNIIKNDRQKMQNALMKAIFQ